MLLPITFGLDGPTGALIMLAGIYYGAQYGGSTTAILVNIPGEATSVVTALDGHQMARQGRAGVALGIAAIGSFFAGTVATLVIAALGAPLTRLALIFGPAEYFSLMVMGLVFAVVLARGSILKAIAMILLGILLSTVGTDLETGQERMTFGCSSCPTASTSPCSPWASSASPRSAQPRPHRDPRRGPPGHRPAAAQPGGLPASYKPVLRGTVIGARARHPARQRRGARAFASYTVEKKLAKDPRRFGRAPSRAWRGRRAPTTPARRPRSSRC
jgi:putative tricarboxylic transport membrane protein